jgi:xanthine dehydrogenase iron-sulfur cluster and FAD-binding subunit A
MLAEHAAGWPSAVTADVSPDSPAPELDAAEVRERMSGNLCRCGAYPSIVRAVLESAAHEEPGSATHGKPGSAAHEEVTGRAHEEVAG